MRSLRYLSVSKLIKRSINTDDFIDFGVELEDLKIIGSTINRIEASAFQHVRTIKTLDLSENNIDYIDPFAFAEVFFFRLYLVLDNSIRYFPFNFRVYMLIGGIQCRVLFTTARKLKLFKYNHSNNCGFNLQRSRLQ